MVASKVLALLLLSSAAFALDCSNLKVNNNKYDLSSIADEVFTVKRTEDLPPTKNRIETYFSVCKAWTQLKDVASEDQCDKSAYICEITTNIKDSQKEKERVIGVKPWTEGKTEIEDLKDEGILIKYTGSRYLGEDLTVRLSLICSKDIKKGEPEIQNVNKTIMEVRWKSSVGCIATDTPGGGSTDKKGMSGVGIFFLLLFIGGVCYVVLGTVYNYTINGMRTFPDMLPNFDFWKNIINSIMDFVGNLSRRSGGYVSL
ncbi:autophagy-related protein 27 [Chytridium lagenaria]|nr:autophagy-related protein 27 [Chytridium lagenaria]